MKYLKTSLQKINRNLPAACYIPFLNCRNYIVLRIAEEECRLFLTAEKAPYLICVETFMPEELLPSTLLSKLTSIGERVTQQLNMPIYIGDTKNEIQNFKKSLQQRKVINFAKYMEKVEW